ncbi:MAG TPA: holdfast anchor protein HfaD [Phenylobacterium sp.]
MIVGTAPFGATSGWAQSSPFLNEQIQLSDVFADQTVDVVEVTDQTTAVTTATGNSFDARADRADLDGVSYQETQGAVSATTRLNASVNAGASSVLATNASGNIGDAGVYGGSMTAVTTQLTTGGPISSLSHIEAPDAVAGDIAASVQSLGNSQGFGVTAGVSGVRATQNNGADVIADGGGFVGQVSGMAAFSAAASGNNITSAADGASSEAMITDQNNVSQMVQASQFTAFGNGYVTQTSATATANNLSAGNQGPLLQAQMLQQNSAYVRAQAESSAYQFGSGTATAFGVGNTLLAGQLGQEVILDATQFNTGGGVEVIAAYTGQDGYDASSSAMAIGNAATGYVCSDCEGRMDIANRQTNDAEIGATSTTTVTGTARSVVGSAHAVGNTGSYYVTRPAE